MMLVNEIINNKLLNKNDKERYYRLLTYKPPCVCSTYINRLILYNTYKTFNIELKIITFETYSKPLLIEYDVSK